MMTMLRPLCLLFALLGSAQAQPRFWLATEDVISGRDMHRPDPLAYMDFFKPGAPWATGAAGLSIFKVSAQFLLSATDEQVTTVFNDMKRRHVAMAVEMGATRREEGCGGGEGYMPAATAKRIGKRVSGLGLKLDYMAMDEPVFMAHVRYWEHVGGLPDCHYPLPTLADQVALTVQHMRLFFPDLQVGDVEVVADYDLREIQANPATRLDDIVIQSWQSRPTRYLPEGEPGTMANLLLRAEQAVDNRR